MTRRLRHRYGAGPSHLVAMLVCFLLAAYGVARILEHPNAIRVLIYLAGAIVVHDLVLLPLYTLVYRAAWRAGRVEAAPRRRVPVLRHLLVPAAISALLLVAWFPLVLGLSSFAGIQHADVGVYGPRWALVTAALFAGSAGVYGIRALRAGGLPELPERGRGRVR